MRESKRPIELILKFVMMLIVDSHSLMAHFGKGKTHRWTDRETAHLESRYIDHVIVSDSSKSGVVHSTLFFGCISIRGSVRPCFLPSVTPFWAAALVGDEVL